LELEGSLVPLQGLVRNFQVEGMIQHFQSDHSMKEIRNTTAAAWHRSSSPHQPYLSCGVSNFWSFYWFHGFTKLLRIAKCIGDGASSDSGDHGRRVGNHLAILDVQTSDLRQGPFVSSILAAQIPCFPCCGVGKEGKGYMCYMLGNGKIGKK
jgi:hypothetical protein